MLKITTIALPESMIEQIDAMLLEKNFASRSDFIRHLIRMWFLGFFEAGRKEDSPPDELPENDLEGIDLEFGIPKKVVDLIESKVKNLN